MTTCHLICWWVEVGWRAKVSPADHPVSEFMFDVCISADGKRNTLQGVCRLLQFSTVIIIIDLVIGVIVYDNVYAAVSLSSWHSHCESSSGSSDECSVSIGSLVIFGPCRSVWATDLPKLSATVLHLLSVFITTQSKNWYSFCRLAEGRRLSWSGWMVTYRDDLPALELLAVQVLTGPSVE